MRIFSTADRVTQPTYGPGTVTSANDRHTIIDFDNHGVRTFITTMATLQATSEPAPPRAKTRRPARKKAAAAPKATSTE